jgi:hypothetical protein
LATGATWWCGLLDGLVVFSAAMRALGEGSGFSLTLLVGDRRLVVVRLARWVGGPPAVSG